MRSTIFAVDAASPAPRQGRPIPFHRVQSFINPRAVAAHAKMQSDAFEYGLSGFVGLLDSDAYQTEGELWRIDYATTLDIYGSFHSGGTGPMLSHGLYTW